MKLAANTSQEVSFEIAPERLMTVGEDGSSRLIRGEYTFTVTGAAPCQRSRELGVSALSVKLKI